MADYINILEKSAARECETQNGVLILDDSIADKTYTDENEVNCWHYCHAKGDVVKGINLLSCMVRYSAHEPLSL